MTAKDKGLDPKTHDQVSGAKLARPAEVPLEDLNTAIEAEGAYYNLEGLLGEGTTLSELCETGSVTVTVAGKQYVLSLKVEAA